MNNLLKDKKIAIIGAGPGGLTLARLLQMDGADVKVYERDKDSTTRAQGATLDLHEESGLAALRQAGLMDAFMANYRPGADNMRITDKDAHILYDDAANADNQTTRPEIDRGPLQQILLQSLQTGTVVWNSHFQSLAPQGNGWTLAFKDTPSAYADVVIAADGSRSKVRPYLTPLKPFYSGIMVIEGAVNDSDTACPTIHKLLNGGKIFALGGGKILIVSSKGDGSLVFYVSWKEDERWAQESSIDFADNAQVLAWFKKEFAGWSNAWAELFENASPSFALRPQYCMPLDQSWTSLPNLTMLGDAAHVMPPFSGEGVNMAMLDALELSQCLIGNAHPTLQSAIAAYEQQMLARFAIVGKDTLEQTEIMHSNSGLQQMLAMFGRAV